MTIGDYISIGCAVLTAVLGGWAGYRLERATRKRRNGAA